MSSHIFGPVPSRRLGNSLGVDLTPTKTCSFNCIYCQLSNTNFHTNKRSEYCDPDTVLKELEESLSGIEKPDWITISGTGEPTLYSKLGYILDKIKTITDIPTCVITNTSLIDNENVRNELMFANRLLPTLTTINQKTFELIHKPTSKISIHNIIEGLRTFLENFKGTTELEIFVCPGINDSASEISGLREYLKSLPYLDSVYLNTAVRNPLNKDLTSATPVALEHFRSQLDLKIPVSTAYEHSYIPSKRLRRRKKAGQNELLKLLLRHPSDEKQLEQVLDLSKEELEVVLNELQLKKKIFKALNGNWTLSF